MKKTYIYGCFLGLSYSASAQTQTQEKPNILWITYEDTSPHLIYDNPSGQTPNMDKLGKEGVRFNAMFSTATISSPSRSAIITGLHATSIGTGNHRSHIPVPSMIKGFPYYLKQAGYHTSNNSKTDYNVANTKAFIKEAWTESNNKATWKHRKEGQPFFSVFNLNTSHASRTFVWKEEKYKKDILAHLPAHLHTDPATLILPPFYRDSPEMRKHMARIYNCVNYTDYRIGQILQELEEDGLKENTIVFVFADHGEGMPRAKGHGLNLGHRIPFYVYVPEKYKHLSGLPMGEQTERVGSFEDLAPTILALAGLEKKDYMEGTNLLAQEHKKEMFYGGKDGADDARDLTREVSDGRFMYSRIYNTMLTESQFKNYTYRTDIYRTMYNDLWTGKLEGIQKTFFADERPIETLYDLENDPWETKNLAQDPAYRKQLLKMRAFCNAQVLETKDVQFIPYGEIMRLYKETGLTPYEYKTNKDIYPIKDVLKVANLSGQGTKVIKQQLKALQHKNAIVRHWALIGLRNQQEDAKAFTTEIRALMGTHESTFNRIEAATILYCLEKDAEAKQVLEYYALGENLFDQWHALRNLQDYAPDQLTFKPIYEKALANLPSKNTLPKELANVYFDVQSTAAGALYIIKHKQEYNKLPK